MSYVLGSDPRDFWFVLSGAAGLSAGLYAITRREDGNPGRVVATTTDGSRIGEWANGVRRRPARVHGFRARLASLRGAFGPRLRENLEPGDLTDVRVREGGECETAWIVEGLDRHDAEFRLSWGFDSAENALAAFRLLDARIARPPQDAGGRPLRLTDREFDEWWIVGASTATSTPAPAPRPS